MTINRDAIDGLRTSLRGKLLEPSDDGYDAARTIWNGMIEKRPGLAVQPAGGRTRRLSGG